jgi:hypothetical protein
VLNNRYFIAAVALGLVVVGAYNWRFFSARGTQSAASAQSSPAPQPGPAEPPRAVEAAATAETAVPGEAQAEEAAAPPPALGPEREARWQAEVADLLASCDFSRNPFLAGPERPVASPARRPPAGNPSLVGIVSCGQRRVAVISEGPGEGALSYALAEGEWFGAHRLARISPRSVDLVGQEGRLHLELEP